MTEWYAPTRLRELAAEAEQFAISHGRDGERRTADLLDRVANALRHLAKKGESPSDAQVERFWQALKDRCCADPKEAKRCVMVGKDDLLAALGGS